MRGEREGGRGEREREREEVKERGNILCVIITKNTSSV